MPGWIYSKTPTPRYSPQVQGLMEQAYGAAIPGLMQAGADTGMPQFPMHRQDLDKLRLGQQQMRELGMGGNQMGIPNMQQALAGMQGAQGQIRDIQPMQQMQLPQAQFPEMNFQPIEEQAMGQFKEQTVPSLANRYIGMGQGGTRSSGYMQALGAAGAGLSRSLAALKAQVLPQWAMQKAQYGLQRAALGQKQQELGLKRDIAAGQLGLGMGELGAKYAGLGIQARQAQAQEMGNRQKALMALLGFSPPAMQGAPIVRQSAWS